jgi:hypothetical protein
MKKTILLATLAVVLVAGCTNVQIPNILSPTNTVLGGTGMVISDFSADQAEVYGLQTDRIMMTVDNKGGHSVPDSESLVYLTGSAVSLSGDNTIYWTGSSSESLIKKFGKEMKPADPVRDTPADEKTVTWSLVAPNISKGEQTPYLFIGRVYSDYQTKVTGNVWVYSQTEADTAKTAGRTLNTATWSATSGPVAINARLTQDPVVLYGTENTFTLVIKVSNAGSGVIYQKGAIDYSTTNPDNLALTSDQINRVTISGNVAGQPLPTDCTNSGNPVEMVGGKDLTLTCDVTITPPATFQGYPISITADYGYFSERSVSVTVSGR